MPTWRAARPWASCCSSHDGLGRGWRRTPRRRRRAPAQSRPGRPDSTTRPAGITYSARRSAPRTGESDVTLQPRHPHLFPGTGKALNKRLAYCGRIRKVAPAEFFLPRFVALQHGNSSRGMCESNTPRRNTVNRLAHSRFDWSVLPVSAYEYLIPPLSAAARHDDHAPINGRNSELKGSSGHVARHHPPKGGPGGIGKRERGPWPQGDEADFGALAAGSSR
jgi:hypothetical protein